MRNQIGVAVSLNGRQALREKWTVLFWGSLLLAVLTTGSLVVAVISGISLLSI